MNGTPTPTGTNGNGLWLRLAGMIISILTTIVVALMGFTLHEYSGRLRRLETGEGILMAPETRAEFKRVDRQLDDLLVRQDRHADMLMDLLKARR